MGGAFIVSLQAANDPNDPNSRTVSQRYRRVRSIFAKTAVNFDLFELPVYNAAS